MPTIGFFGWQLVLILAPPNTLMNCLAFFSQVPSTTTVHGANDLLAQCISADRDPGLPSNLEAVDRIKGEKEGNLSYLLRNLLLVRFS